MLNKGKGHIPLGPQRVDPELWCDKEIMCVVYVLQQWEDGYKTDVYTLNTAFYGV